MAVCEACGARVALQGALYGALNRVVPHRGLYSLAALFLDIHNVKILHAALAGLLGRLECSIDLRDGILVGDDSELVRDECRPGNSPAQRRGW